MVGHLPYRSIMRSLPANNRRSKCRGFTIMEVVLAMTILLLMVTLYGAVAPICLQATRASGDYSMVEAVAHHKIEQLRGCGFNNITQTELASLAIIDSTQPTGYPNNAPTGFPGGSTAYSFTTADNLTGFLPSNATGIMTVAPDPNAPSGQAYDVNITITWKSATSPTRSYTDCAIIANV
jgi:prepilin-type N-terminal cleavage/methylation domain-containing protein